MACTSIWSSSPEYRRHVFGEEHLGSLREVLEAVCRDFGATLVEMNGGDDHMHLLVEYPPKIAVSALVNSLKGVSSRLAKKRHPELARRYWKRALWTPSYFAAS